MLLYIIIYQVETDGDIVHKTFVDDELCQKWIERMGFTDYDFMVCKGEVLKGFNQKYHKHIFKPR